MGMGQNPIALVNIKIAGKWMFLPVELILIGIDPYPYIYINILYIHTKPRHRNFPATLKPEGSLVSHKAS
jgi:hypothetical protein